MTPAKLLKFLSAVGPVTAALPEVKDIFDDIVATFGEADQAMLKDAYAELIAANDAAHARLQAKLAAAARQ